MSCLSDLELSAHADGESSAAGAAALEAHLASCAACRSRAAAFTATRALFVEAFAEPAKRAVPAPRFAAGPRPLLAAAAAALALSGAIGLAWMLVRSTLAPLPLGWLDPFDADRCLRIALGLVAFLFREGNTMLTHAFTLAALAAGLLLLAWLAVAKIRPRGGAWLAAALLGAAVLPAPSRAVEVRQAKQELTVPADETIHDTLVAAADTVTIDGTVDGDVIAAGRRVVVRGHVTGLLVAAAENLSIEGPVDGSVIAAAADLDLTGAHVAGNVYSFGRQVAFGGDTRVADDAFVFARSADIGSGGVGRDLSAFGRDIALGAEVTRNVAAFGENVKVLPATRIGGALVAHVPKPARLDVAAGATVVGGVRTEVWQPPQRPSIDKVPFIAREAVRFSAAFLVGLVVLWLAPSLRSARLEDGGDALITAGIGLVTLLVVPIVAVVVGLTIIGLPIAIAAMLLWGAALYFAKILLAYFIGRTVLGARIEEPTVPLSLAVGLVIVLAVVNVPFVGGLLNVLLTLAGVGMLLEAIYRRFQWSHPRPA